MSARKLIEKLRSLIKPDPEPPEDPHSYVTAPKKPRLPGLSAAAAERPDE